MDARRWLTGWLTMLLVAAVAACGSESQANEADDGADASAPAETVYVAEDSGAVAPSEVAAADEPATDQRSDRSSRSAAEAPRRDPEPATAPPDDPVPASDDETTTADPAPTTEPAAEPEPATATLAAGTSLSATLDRELSTKTTRAGDTFSATVTSPVVESRTVLVPEGAKLNGRVTGVREKSGEQQAAITVTFDALTIDGREYPLDATLTEVDTRTERELKDEGKKIGGGAAAGGLLGALIGGDVKGAVIGAAAGAAAGTVITLATRAEHAVLPVGSAMTVRLERSVEVRM